MTPLGPDNKDNPPGISPQTLAWGLLAAFIGLYILYLWSK